MLVIVFVCMHVYVYVCVCVSLCFHLKGGFGFYFDNGKRNRKLFHSRFVGFSSSCFMLLTFNVSRTIPRLSGRLNIVERLKNENYSETSFRAF